MSLLHNLWIPLRIAEAYYTGKVPSRYHLTIILHTTRCRLFFRTYLSTSWTSFLFFIEHRLHLRITCKWFYWTTVPVHKIKSQLWLHVSVTLRDMLFVKLTTAYFSNFLLLTACDLINCFDNTVTELMKWNCFPFPFSG